MSRFVRRSVATNKNENYDNVFKERNVSHVEQYRTPKIVYPTEQDKKSLDVLPHFWAVGDAFWKLAAKHYGNPELWWCIAWYNKKPGESEVSYGEKIFIPFPLARVLQILR